MALDGQFETTREQRARRCDKCGGQPWLLCFWWNTPDGPSGCSEDGNISTCGVASWQLDMHRFRQWREAHIVIASEIHATFGYGPQPTRARTE